VRRVVGADQRAKRDGRNRVVADVA